MRRHVRTVGLAAFVAILAALQTIPNATALARVETAVQLAITSPDGVVQK